MDVSWRHVVEGLVVAVIVVVVDEAADLLLELPRELIGLQLDDDLSDR